MSHASSELTPEEGVFAPVRFYDKPVWRDPWLTLGIGLVLIPAVIDIWLIQRLGWADLPAAAQQETITEFVKNSVIIFLIWSVLPGAIRLLVRRRRLNETRPDSLEPGWFPDPGYKGSERYWTGLAWTDYIAQPRRIDLKRNYIILAIALAIALTINIARAQTDIKHIDVSAAYAESIETYNDFVGQLPEDLNSLSWREYAQIIDTFEPGFSTSAERLDLAVSALDDGNVYGVKVQAFKDYNHDYVMWATTLRMLTAAFAECASNDETCLETAFEPLSAQLSDAGIALDDSAIEISELIVKKWQ